MEDSLTCWRLDWPISSDLQPRRLRLKIERHTTARGESVDGASQKHDRRKTGMKGDIISQGDEAVLERAVVAMPAVSR